MNRIVLVGQAPGKRPGEPLAGAAGRRLAALAGMDLPAFLDKFDRVNLLDEFPGKAGKGDRFDAKAALERADQLREELAGRKAVLLGRLVARAFRLPDDTYDWFQVVEAPPGVELAVMPHPSGVSHWWNDEANVRRASDFMKRVKLGLLSIKRPQKKAVGRPEKFTPEQVALAIDAADGIPIDAAAILAEETGLSCSRENIVQYIDRYPELGEVRVQARQKIGDMAERNVRRAIMEGDADISYKVLRSEMFADRGYGIASHLQFSGKISHSHKHEHRHEHVLRDMRDELGLEIEGHVLPAPGEAQKIQ